MVTSFFGRRFIFPFVDLLSRIISFRSDPILLLLFYLIVNKTSIDKLTAAVSNVAVTAMAQVSKVSEKVCSKVNVDMLNMNNINTNSPYTYAAGAVLGLYVGRKIVKKSFNMIDTICNRTYIYNICWEDPAVDHQILKITPDDVIFRICSAGDIVLDYAIEGPSKIVVCDMNQHQLWLFELKIRMLREKSRSLEFVQLRRTLDASRRVWMRLDTSRWV